MLNDEIIKQSESVIKFLKEGSVEVVNAPVGDIYLVYSAFCLTHGFYVTSKILFSKEIQKHANVFSTTTSKNGRSIRVFRAR